MHSHISLLKGLIVALGFFLFVFVALMMIIGESISNPPLQVDYSQSHAITDLSQAFPTALSKNTTVKSGDWSAASTWSNGVPTQQQTAVISSGHSIVYDSPQSHISGVHIMSGATLTFDSTKNVTLSSSENVVVEGTLTMKPGSASLIHTLKFSNANGTGIDNFKFVGGGMDPIAQDVGLWVVEAGKLDLVGATKTPWTNASGAIAQGANSFQLKTTPSGWRVGDEIAISPTLPSTDDTSRVNEWLEFDEAAIASISGSSISLSKVTQYPHPKVNNTWTAEVMNLTRNVRIEGTPPSGAYLGLNLGHERYHNAHIFIRNSSPVVHNIRNVALRYMGPRDEQTEDKNSSPPTQLVMGRYVLHFHHSADNNRGSLVENVVARNTGNRAFVPHASHGITFRGTVAYDVGETAYWWDIPAGAGSEEARSDRTTNTAAFITDDTVYENCVGAKFNPIKRLGGVTAQIFLLGAGTNNTVKNCVAVGNTSRGQNASGFHWPSQVNSFPNVWNFSDVITHNNKANGIFTWQNTQGDHVVSDFAAYHNGASGIDHGAYGNHYQYVNFTLFGNAKHSLQQHSQTGKGAILRERTEKTQTFDRPTIVGGPSAVIIQKHSTGFIDVNAGYKYLWPTEEGSPTIYKDCDFRGQSISKIYVNEPSRPPSGETPDNPALIYFIRCNLTPEDFYINQVHPLSVYKVQNTDTPVNGSYGFIMKFDANQNPIITDLKCELPENDEENVEAILAGAVCKVGSSTTPTGDATSPTVSLTSPASGATVSGSVNLSATASDNVGVSGVTFKVDGVTVGAEDTTTPYTYSWNSALVSNGSHTISATARDAAGNIKTASLSVTVSNQTTTVDATPPSVSMTAPLAGAVVKGDTTVSASATDNKAVAGVQFKVNGTNLGTEDTTAPYAKNWRTAEIADGTYTLSAVARDAAGNKATAQSITVTVDNIPNAVSDTTNPTVSLSSPAQGATVSATTTLSAAAADNVGVVGVTFRIDNVVVTEDTTSPYSVSWNSKSVSNGSHTVTATARDATGNTMVASRSFSVSNQTETVDSTQPNVSITSPAQGSTVKGTIEVTAAATDNKAVTEVVFRLNGALLGSKDTSSPYSVSWNTTAATEGSNTLTAEAKDAAGNSRVSSTITVTVDNVQSTSGGGGGGSSSSNDDDDDDEDSYEDDLDDDVVVVPPPYVPPAQTPVLGRVITTSNLSVRTSPGTAYPQIAVVPAGTRGSVLAGPTYVYGYAWLHVAYDTGVTGWSSRTWLVTDTSVAPSPVYTPPVTTGSTLTDAEKAVILTKIAELQILVLQLQAQLNDIKVAEGDAAPTPPSANQVITTDNLSVRTSPGTAYPIVGVVPAGSLGTVLEGPVYVYGYAWLNVSFSTGVTGWSSQTWLKSY